MGAVPRLGPHGYSPSGIVLIFRLPCIRGSSLRTEMEGTSQAKFSLTPAGTKIPDQVRKSSTVYNLCLEAKVRLIGSCAPHMNPKSPTLEEHRRWGTPKFAPRKSTATLYDGVGSVKRHLWFASRAGLALLFLKPGSFPISTKVRTVNLAVDSGSTNQSCKSPYEERRSSRGCRASRVRQRLAVAERNPRREMTQTHSTARLCPHTASQTAAAICELSIALPPLRPQHLFVALLVFLLRSKS